MGRFVWKGVGNVVGATEGLDEVGCCVGRFVAVGDALGAEVGYAVGCAVETTTSEAMNSAAIDFSASNPGTVVTFSF